MLSVSPSLLNRASGLLGIAVPSNLLFLVSLLILFGVSLQLSIEVGVLEEQSRRLAEEVGAIRLRLEDLEWRTRMDQESDAVPASMPETRSEGIPGAQRLARLLLGGGRPRAGDLVEDALHQGAGPIPAERTDR